MKIQPYIIIPNLIEQPTWGGRYIAKVKQLNDDFFASKSLGQSYELYSHSKFSLKRTTLDKPSLEIGNPQNPLETKEITYNDSPFPVSHLIQYDQDNVLGSNALAKHGNSVNLLNKLTQAKGNSYQVHIKQNEKDPGKWKSKPESWYYLERGVATLGVKKQTDWKKYKQACIDIHAKAQELCRQIQSKKILLNDARDLLKTYIHKVNISQYVHTVVVEKDNIVNLATGGVHHSWEENTQHAPKGNIIYEVQRNVFDPVSTIRCFDKGKIKNDGSIRNLQIDDYFTYVDRSEWANNPNNHMKIREQVFTDATSSVYSVFSSDDYAMVELEIAGITKNTWTKTKKSYHHIYCKEGACKLVWDKTNWIISTGYSLFLPSGVDSYTLSPYKCKKVSILNTYVP